MGSTWCWVANGRRDSLGRFIYAEVRPHLGDHLAGCRQLSNLSLNVLPVLRFWRKSLQEAVHVFSQLRGKVKTIGGSERSIEPEDIIAMLGDFLAVDLLATIPSSDQIEIGTGLQGNQALNRNRWNTFNRYSGTDDVAEVVVTKQDCGEAGNVLASRYRSQMAIPRELGRKLRENSSIITGCRASLGFLKR